MTEPREERGEERSRLRLRSGRRAHRVGGGRAGVEGARGRRGSADEGRTAKGGVLGEGRSTHGQGPGERSWGGTESLQGTHLCGLGLRLDVLTEGHRPSALGFKWTS